MLTAVLEVHNTLDKFHSGFVGCILQTALLRISSDLLMQADVGYCSVLVLLDLNAAFDTVDHCILINRLTQWVGIVGSALYWFSSHLSDRIFLVTVDSNDSSTEFLCCEIPQGFVLGPMLFSLYFPPLGQKSNFKDV